MTELFNLSNIHKKEASKIDALALLHFCADAVKDWECTLKNCNHTCPFWYEVTHIRQNNQPLETKTCILDAIKDLAYINLEKDEFEQGEENTHTGTYR